jgi:anhydro-N-acetylmuramic acid kinase
LLKEGEKVALAVGLMSGTSLDGVDAALVEIEGSGLATEVKLVHFLTLPIPEELKQEIRACCQVEQSSVQLVCSLNFKLGALFADAVKHVCREAGVSMEELDFIGSHGQTVFHIPKSFATYTRSTLQIGEPAVIAYETKTKVVSDFRVMDVAAGGEGAPLVPYTEYLLYRSDRDRILQNIGGIGNATVIPKQASLGEIFAFDTGPGNMIIDEICQRLTEFPFDRDGEFAAKGNVHMPLLQTLMSHPFISAPPPKSTGREAFGAPYADDLLKEWKGLKTEDWLATITMFTARSIAENYERFIFPAYPEAEIVIGGGGSYNRTLLKMLKACMPNRRILTQEDLGFSSAAKEAIAFAVLANETLHGLPANVTGATGAKRRVVLGHITPVPY